MKVYEYYIPGNDGIKRLKTKKESTAVEQIAARHHGTPWFQVREADETTAIVIEWSVYKQEDHGYIKARAEKVYR